MNVTVEHKDKILVAAFINFISHFCVLNVLWILFHILSVVAWTIMYVARLAACDDSVLVLASGGMI